MSLLARIVGLETAAARPSPAGDGTAAWLAELTEEELDQVLVNLLIAGGPPADAATAAIWEKATTRAGLTALTAAEFDAICEWVTADDGDALAEPTAAPYGLLLAEGV
jgi:hypothetical protein